MYYKGREKLRLDDKRYYKTGENKKISLFGKKNRPTREKPRFVLFPCRHLRAGGKYGITSERALVGKTCSLFCLKIISDKSTEYGLIREKK